MAFEPSKPAKGKVDKDGSLHLAFVAGDSLRLHPTWIKADVEGSELALLKGFRETILQYKPRLSICVYHNSYDLWEISRYILSLVPEYRFMLRRYGRTFDETVLYAALPGDFAL